MFADGYSQYYDLFNRDKPYKKEIQFVYNWAKRPENILDIGCGTADYWKFYPPKVSLYGLEKSRAMIQKSHYRSRISRGDVNCPLWKNRRRDILNFDCVTALFDVINYIPKHDWWKNMPLKKGGYFIFDVWNKTKVDKTGFKDTFKRVNGISRRIVPLKYDGHKVDLEIQIFEYYDMPPFTETHRMYIYSLEEIVKFCGKEFQLVDVKPTKNWQTWYKCRRK